MLELRKPNFSDTRNFVEAGMKKIASILLILVYSLATFGVGLKEFYCCGKLKSVGVAFADFGKDKSCKGDNGDEGCCKTRYHYHKVKDNHLATDCTATQAKLTIDLHLHAISVQPIVLGLGQIAVINGIHAPPFDRQVPIYISNCVFRI